MKPIIFAVRMVATTAAVVALLVFAAVAAAAEHTAEHAQCGGNPDAGCVIGNPSAGSECEGGNGGQAGGGVGCQGGSQAERDEPCGRDTDDGALNTGGKVPGCTSQGTAVNQNPHCSDSGVQPPVDGGNGQPPADDGNGQQPPVVSGVSEQPAASGAVGGVSTQGATGGSSATTGTTGTTGTTTGGFTVSALPATGVGDGLAAASYAGWLKLAVAGAVALACLVHTTRRRPAVSRLPRD